MASIQDLKNLLATMSDKDVEKAFEVCRFHWIARQNPVDPEIVSDCEKDLTKKLKELTTIPFTLRVDSYRPSDCCDGEEWDKNIELTMKFEGYKEFNILSRSYVFDSMNNSHSYEYCSFSGSFDSMPGNCHEYIPRGQGSNFIAFIEYVDKSTNAFFGDMFSELEYDIKPLIDECRTDFRAAMNNIHQEYYRLFSNGTQCPFSIRENLWSYVRCPKEDIWDFLLNVRRACDSVNIPREKQMEYVKAIKVIREKYHA